MRAHPGNSIIEYAEITQLAYSSFFLNLPAFFEATTSNTVQVSTKEGFSISFPTEQCFPLVMANLIVDFPRPLAQEQIDKLAQIGYQQVKVNNKTALVFKSPTLAVIRIIRSYKPNSLTRTTIDAVNMVYVGSILLIHRIYSSFSSANCYPAFSDTEQSIPCQDFDDVFEWANKDSENGQRLMKGYPSISTSNEMIISDVPIYSPPKQPK